jgi:hypothetical protein
MLSNKIKHLCFLIKRRLLDFNNNNNNNKSLGVCLFILFLIVKHYTMSAVTKPRVSIEVNAEILLIFDFLQSAYTHII